MAYFNLGDYTRPVTTHSAVAQRWFDRGLAWAYGFNHEEAVSCFRKALAEDPDCAMAWWGVAYAMGPNYNKPWDAFDDEELASALNDAHEAAVRANEAAGNCSELEQELCQAIQSRCKRPEPTEDLERWNDDYANLMRHVHKRFPEDSDVAALFAEALMNRTPWALWDLETGGIPEGADTEEAVVVLERGIRQRAERRETPHAGLSHMYIHALEMSPHPERALHASDDLRNLVPDSGHLRHMPSHIYVMCGDYQAVVDGNLAAVEVDEKFAERNGAANFYSLYRCHDAHFVIYGAMFLGQQATAMAAAEKLVGMLPAELLEMRSPPMADWLEGFVGMKQHVLIRFGKWQEIIDQELPENQELFCATTAMMRYSRAVARANLGDVDEAEREFELFGAALEAVPETRTVFNNTCKDIFAVAREMALGETEYHRKNFDSAFAHLRKAVRLDDGLIYDEPWGWMQPARHALGALLLEQGELAAAAQVYREDLGYDPKLNRPCRHPNNVWSLHGYHECLTRLGRFEEAAAISQALAIALGRADVEINASCYCRKNAS